MRAIAGAGTVARRWVVEVDADAVDGGRRGGGVSGGGIARHMCGSRPLDGIVGGGGDAVVNAESEICELVGGIVGDLEGAFGSAGGCIEEVRLEKEAPRLQGREDSLKIYTRLVFAANGIARIQSIFCPEIKIAVECCYPK